MINELIIKCFLAPGDIIVLTGALRELHKCYPEIILGTLTPYPEITYGNPLFTLQASKNKSISTINIDYLKEFNYKNFSGNHLIDGFISSLNDSLSLNIKKTNMFPEIILTNEEKNSKHEFLNSLGLKEPYWLLFPGIKNDMPLKAWNPNNWQKLINILTNEYKHIHFYQVGSEKFFNPIFENIQSLVGKTEDLRDLIKLCFFSYGSIGGISLHMHLMAAFSKPSIIIAGGRETPRWSMYPNHTFLHNVGQFSCCIQGGCWNKQRFECKKMVNKYPICMENITIESVIKAFEHYNFIYKEDLNDARFGKSI